MSALLWDLVSNLVLKLGSVGTGIKLSSAELSVLASALVAR